MNDILKFRHAIRSGNLVLGAAISFADPLVSDALADSVGFLWIDMEHSGMTTETVDAYRCGPALPVAAF